MTFLKTNSYHKILDLFIIVVGIFCNGNLKPRPEAWPEYVISSMALPSFFIYIYLSYR